MSKSGGVFRDKGALTWKPGIAWAPPDKQPKGCTDPITLFYAMMVPILFQNGTATERVSHLEVPVIKERTRVHDR